MKYKKGDILIDSCGLEYQIIFIHKPLYFLSINMLDIENSLCEEFSCSEENLDRNGYVLKKKEKLAPKRGDKYQYVTFSGRIKDSVWNNNNEDKFRLFMGNYFHQFDVEGIEEYRKKFIELIKLGKKERSFKITYSTPNELLKKLKTCIPANKNILQQPDLFNS